MSTFIAYALTLVMSGYVVGVVVSLVWIVPSSVAIGAMSGGVGRYIDTQRRAYFWRLACQLPQYFVSGLIEGYLSVVAAQWIFEWLDAPITEWVFIVLLGAKVMSGYLFFRSTARQLPFSVLPANLIGFLVGMTVGA